MKLLFQFFQCYQHDVKMEPNAAKWHQFRPKLRTWYHQGSNIVIKVGIQNSMQNAGRTLFGPRSKGGWGPIVYGFGIDFTWILEHFGVHEIVNLHACRNLAQVEVRR